MQTCKEVYENITRGNETLAHTVYREYTEFIRSGNQKNFSEFKRGLISLLKPINAGIIEIKQNPFKFKFRCCDGILNVLFHKRKHGDEPIIKYTIERTVTTDAKMTLKELELLKCTERNHEGRLVKSWELQEMLYDWSSQLAQKLYYSYVQYCEMCKTKPIGINNLEMRVKSITIQYGISVEVSQVSTNPFKIIFSCNDTNLLSVTISMVDNKLQVMAEQQELSKSLKQRIEKKTKESRDDYRISDRFNGEGRVIFAWELKDMLADEKSPLVQRLYQSYITYCEMCKVNPIDIYNLELQIKKITLQFGISVSVLEVYTNPFKIIFGCRDMHLLRVTMEVVDNKIQVKNVYHIWNKSLKKRVEKKNKRIAKMVNENH